MSVNTGAYSADYSQAFDPPDIPAPAALSRPSYVDVETLLVQWLAADLNVRTCTDLPSNLAGAVPVVQVTRVGGPDDIWTLDRPLVDVDAYGPNRSVAADLAEQVRISLRFILPGQIVAGAYVARVDTISGPSWRPYDNTTVRRFGASYQLTTQKGSTP